MSIKNLSKKLNAERGSISLKLPGTAVLDYSAATFNELKRVLDDIRGSSWSDRGFSFNLTETMRVNDGWIKLILNTVDYVIKNNSINMDLWVCAKPSEDIKNLLKIIETKKQSALDRSIRIRIARETKVNFFFLLNWAFGLLFIILGSTSLVNAATVKTKWFEGVNSVQLIGSLMVLVSLLPYAFKYVKQWQLLKKN